MTVPYVRELVAPTFEPVTLTEARLWCREPEVEDDALLLVLITAARERAEDITGRAFTQRQLELRLDAFPSVTDIIELPGPPLLSVQYVTYATADGDLTLSGSPDAFIVDTGSEPGRIMPLFGTSWPTAQAQVSSVRIGYTCGYTNSNKIPKRVRQWMQMRIATWYENRENLKLTSMSEMPRDFVDGLLDHLRVGPSFA